MEQSYLQQLELDKPEHWVEEAAKEAGNFIDQKLETFGHMTTNFLLDYNHQKFLMVLKLNNEGRAAVDLCQFMFTVGYLIGLSKGETQARDQQLKKLLGED